MIANLEIGYLTPPVGLNVFVVARYAKRPLQEIFAGVWPHVFSHLMLLSVLVAFPSIILWLPKQMAP
jgi:TRAP-type C4-dicarboxylate transport system permease large subunit